MEEIKRKGLALIKEKMPDIIKSIDDLVKDGTIFPDIDVPFPLIE